MWRRMVCKQWWIMWCLRGEKYWKRWKSRLDPFIMEICKWKRERDLGHHLPKMPRDFLNKVHFNSFLMEGAVTLLTGSILDNPNSFSLVFNAFLLWEVRFRNSMLIRRRCRCHSNASRRKRVVQIADVVILIFKSTYLLFHTEVSVQRQNFVWKKLRSNYHNIYVFSQIKLHNIPFRLMTPVFCWAKSSFPEKPLKFGRFKSRNSLCTKSSRRHFNMS